MLVQEGMSSVAIVGASTDLGTSLPLRTSMPKGLVIETLATTKATARRYPPSPSVSLLWGSLKNVLQSLSVPLLSLSCIFRRGGHRRPKIPLLDFELATRPHEPWSEL